FINIIAPCAVLGAGYAAEDGGWSVGGLGFFKGKFYSPGICFAAWGLAGGGGQAGCNVTAGPQLQCIGDICCHSVICIAIAEFRLQTCEEILCTAFPCDQDLHAWHLSAV